MQEDNHYLHRGREMGFLPPEVERSTQDWLERNASCLDDHEPCCQIHFDMHAANIRVERDPHGKWRLRCLYDFEMAREGCPMCRLHQDTLRWGLYSSSRWFAPSLLQTLPSDDILAFG